uniref:Metalloendopeptidase n=1 Tax=Caenorhabditis tropicalis TaxID=1561998 RepID=A0A1I7SXC5_9PELO
MTLLLVFLIGLTGVVEGQGWRPWDRFNHVSSFGNFGGNNWDQRQRGPAPRDIPPPIPPPGFHGNHQFGGNIIKITEIIDLGKNKTGDILSDFKDFHNRHKKLGRKEWKGKVKQFCHRFPGHPNCRRGKIPDQNELEEMVNQFKKGGIGRFLKRVPKIHIEDPLARVDPKLKELLESAGRGFGHLNSENVNKLRDICKKRKCREQPESAKKTRELFTQKLADFEAKLTGKDKTDAVQLRFDRTLQIKEALLEKGNLTADIAPVDNGVYDLDTMLTEEQANILLNELNKAGVGDDEIPLPETDSDDEDDDDTNSTATDAPGTRARKSALYFEGNLIKKWDPSSPIRYVLDNSLEDLDKNDVRAAIYEIEKNTCIRFKELASPPTGSHIVYYKVDSPTFCGLSYVGRADPANPVYLSFGCENNKGVAIHETMHALGVAHQHLRNDRDQFITINWSNIDPQQYDAFVVVDSKLYTSYGVKYAYDSIMHYNGYTAAQNIAIPTMNPKTNSAANLRILGQRQKMGATDIELLKKMYCQPGCEDKNVYCGAWALKDLCRASGHDQYMAANCKKSCNLCSVGK